MLNLKKRIIFYWEWFCRIFTIGLGILLTLVGIIGFIASEHPLEGCFEFALYGPIIIFAAIKMIKPSVLTAT